jgi:hypothetical protein
VNNELENMSRGKGIASFQVFVLAFFWLDRKQPNTVLEIAATFEQRFELATTQI